MNKYFGVITSELGNPSNNYIVEQIFHHNKDELVAYCEKLVNSYSHYPAMADYYIYQLIDVVE